jgi:four helix bundle protein
MEYENEKPTTFFRFEDLRVYHKALDYTAWVHRTAKHAGNDPIAKSFFDRYINSSHGIALNIAEGSSRNKSQFVYYLKMAKSSVRECVVLSTVGQSLHYMTDEAFDESKNQLMEMTKMVGALIGSLQRSVKAEGGMDNEDDNE